MVCLSVALAMLAYALCAGGLAGARDLAGRNGRNVRHGQGSSAGCTPYHRSSCHSGHHFGDDHGPHIQAREACEASMRRLRPIVLTICLK
jgi:hypothetical protein